MSRPEVTNDSPRLLEGKRHLPDGSSQLDEVEPFYPELLASSLDGGRIDAEVLRNIQCVDTGRESLETSSRVLLPTIHNAFWVAGKVPTLNDILDAKSKNQPRFRSIIMRQRPEKGKGGARYSLYNDIKQDWKSRTRAALGPEPKKVAQCHLGYVIVEETIKRDPSNICSAAVKFIEDGIVAAGALPNDGWSNILGIRLHWVHRKGREPGVFVVMSAERLSEEQLVLCYEARWSSR